MENRKKPVKMVKKMIIRNWNVKSAENSRQFSTFLASREFIKKDDLWEFNQL